MFTTLRYCLLSVLITIFSFSYAQVPVISYSSPQTYFEGASITPLAPTSSGVAAPGPDTGPITVGSGFNNLTGIAVDHAGNVYVCENGANAIKEIPAGGGTTLTLGSGFIAPTGVAVDVAGNVYVVDNGNNAVKEIPVGGGSIITLGSGFNSPYGVAVDASGNLYVGDSNNNEVKEILAGSNTIVLVASGLNHPTGVAVDAAGNIYVADQGNNSIKKILAAGGTIVTLTSGNGNPNGVAVDAFGNVYFADLSSSSIKEIPAAGGNVINVGTGFVQPVSVAVSGNNIVYLGDKGNNAIKKIASVGGYFIAPALPPGLSLNNTTGIISGTPTTLNPATNYTVTAYNSTGGTSANVNITVTDALLSSIILNPASPLTTVTGSGYANYTAAVASNVTSTSVIPTARIANTAITVNGVAVASGASSASIPLSAGPNTITTVATAPGGGPGQTYIITVGRGASVATLSSISLSTGALTPVAGTNNFTASVGSATTSATVTPTSTDPAAKVTVAINGGPATAVTSGTASASLPLSLGLNIITTIVTAQDGVTATSYTITVTRVPSSDASLSDIKLTPASALSIIPAVGNVTTYTTAVSFATTSITVMPITADPNATVTISGGALALETFSLAAGVIDEINIVVTAQDGITTRNYSILVDRAPSPDAGLKNLVLSSGALTPAFNTGTTTYAASVPNATTNLSLTPFTSDVNATLKVNGTVVASGAASPSIALADGAVTTITVVVTAQDYSVTKTYTVAVTRAKSDASLSSLALNSGTLTPAFAAGITNYTASISSVATAITITPTASDSNATIKVNGAAVITGTASASVPLSAGGNTITIMVTAQDGVTTETYTIVVSRPPSGNAALSVIKLTPASTLTNTGTVGTTTTYTTSVANATATVTVTPTAQDATATIKVNGVVLASGTASGPITLAVGQTTINTVVTAQNGTTTKTYSIIVTRTAASNAPIISYSPPTNVFQVGTAIASLSPVNTGSTPLSYSISPALPTGLSFNTTTGVMSGTPTVFSAAANYIVAAANANGSGTFTINITVNSAAPVITYTSPDVYTLNGAISPLSPVNAGGIPTSYSAEGLPAGLSINPTTGVISGTPTVVTAATNYTVTATNAAGSGTAVINIATVIPGIPVFTYTAPQIYTAGIAITPLAPDNSGGTPISYSASGLPAGLMLNTTTGAISGTPAAVTTATLYTITATNANGSDTFSILITVVPEPPVIAYTTPDIFPAGVAIAPLTPVNTGGTPTSYSINTALPQGLAFNTTTGTISGTPAAVTAVTNYTVTATNAGGSGTTVINITTVTPGPPVITYNIPDVEIYNVGSAIAPIAPNNAGGTPVTYSISDLPLGLTFNTTNGVISGTPTEVTAAADYTITATNASGSGTFTINITVNPERPHTGYNSPNIFTVGVTITPLAPDNLGSTPTIYSVYPSLPPGLVLNTTTGIISGTPTAATVAAKYLVSAINANGTGTFVINITTLIGGAPAITYDTPQVYVAGTAIAPLAPHNSGGTPSSYFINPALPAGLAFDNSTGIISGTPAAATAAADYSVFVSNSSGGSTSIINITVAPERPVVTYATPDIFPAGSAIAPLAPVNTGSAPTSYSIDTALPAGLVFNTTTGLISGTPAVVTGPTTYTITATNSAGTGTTTLTITVTHALSGNATLNIIKLTPASALTNTGTVGSTTTYTTSVANATATVTVTPMAQDATATIKVKGVVVASGTASGPVALAVGQNTINTVVSAQNGTTIRTYVIIVTRAAAGNAPVISYSPSTNVYAIDNVIAPLAPVNTGTMPLGYSISPALPAGLLFNTTTGIISGTPATAAAAANYIVTATNANGSGTFTISITVNLTAPVIAYTTPEVYSEGTPISPLSPVNASGTPTSYSASGLPAGLTIDPTTGVISGIPAAATAATNYIITATNTSGSGTFTINIATVISGAPAITYATPQVYTLETPIPLLSPVNAGGIPTSYSINPGLPPGLWLNTTNGAIIGTPFVDTAPANYIITATNASGSGTFTINIATVISAVPVITYNTPETYIAGTAIAPLTPNNTGGAPTSYSISGLPAGLVLDPTTGVISGTPTAVTTGTIYTITATNTNGSGTFSISVTVEPEPPLIEYSSPDIFTSGVAIAPLAPVSTGSTPTSYSISPGLPAGLTLNTTTGVISGKPAAATTTTVYTVTATDPSGTGSTTLNITVMQAISANASLTTIKLTPASALTNTGTTGTITNYTTSVPAATISVTVTPTTQDPNATVKVNGTTVLSETASASIPLAVGANTITTAVTAQDGTTTHTYSITVTRAASSNNASLSIIKLTPASSLTNTGTTGTTTTYITTAASATASVTITPTAQEAHATIKVNGVAVTSGTASAPITLPFGQTTITTVVTAQDGTTTHTYSITITRLSNNALLSTIKLTPASTLSNTGTTGTTTTYTTSVSNATTSVTVTPTAQDANAKIKVNGVAVTSGTASGSIALAVGSNTINTVVTAQDGTTTRTYSITVTRATGPLHSLYLPVSVVQPADNLNIENDGVVVHQGISPNGDGINDFLTIDGIIAYPDNSLQIIDRNGTLIYKAKGYNNIANVFDGHSGINGRMQHPGTYFYSLDYIADGQNRHKTGFIILRY